MFIFFNYYCIFNEFHFSPFSVSLTVYINSLEYNINILNVKYQPNARPSSTNLLPPLYPHW